MTNWNEPLADPITLRDGAVVETLHDARAVLLRLMEGVLHSEALAHAGKLLLEAAEDGDERKVKAATDQVRLCLGARAMLPIEYKPKKLTWARRRRA